MERGLVCYWLLCQNWKLSRNLGACSGWADVQARCYLGIFLYHHPGDSLCLSWIELCFLEPTFSYFWLPSLGKGTFGSFLRKVGRKVNFLKPTCLKMPLLNHRTWVIIDWVENSRLEMIFPHNFRHCFIEYLMPCGSFVWNLETYFFLFLLFPLVEFFWLFFPIVLEFLQSCVLFWSFSSFVCVLSGPFQLVLGDFLEVFLWFYFFFWNSYYPILDLLGWFYNFLLSFSSLCSFSLLWRDFFNFIFQPLCCVFHLCNIFNFQSSFFLSEHSFYLKKKCSIIVSWIFLSLKILMIVFEGFFFLPLHVSYSSKFLFSMFGLYLSFYMFSGVWRWVIGHLNPRFV